MAAVAIKSQSLQAGLQPEYAAARSVRPPAYGDLTVRWRNGHRFIVWHQLAIDHPAVAGRRCAGIALAVVVATAPFAGAVLVGAAIDPAIMRKYRRSNEKHGYKQ